MKELRVKISKINAVYIIAIVLLAILDVNCFYLIKIPSSLSRIWGVYQKGLLVIISFLLFLWAGGWKNGTSFMKKYCICVFVSIGVAIVISTLRYYNNILHNVILEANHYLLIVLAFPLLRFIKRSNGYDRVFQVLNYIAFITYIIFIAQSFAYNTAGRVFLNISVYERSDMIRITLKSVGCLMVVYNFCQVWCYKINKNSWFHIVQLVLGIYCVLFIQQTRAYYLVIGGSIFAVLLFYKTEAAKKLRNILIVISVGIAILGTGVADIFMASFSSSSAEYAGTLARTGAFGYFWSEFLANPLIGHGIINSGSQMLMNIRTGPYGIYHYADTGIMGLFAQLGLLAVGVYVWPVIHWIKLLRKNMKDKRTDPFLIGLMSYILFSTPTLLCINQALIFIWPFCVAVFAYYEELVRSRYYE
ncbi:O-antigen ligase family protein [Pseudobacteroides cellulosolvens]|uniref:O-antigen polymerase n=1 Tax=Pseudobacteroides cellulosolvens ATCC 35603 = DSM 2933 TaxID=398512 RepID=A0A0L6JL68_9FIRM|nr:hypothetical protein [Pseudobacteroides cellulosolvens]KNY26571.1 hypothetical protein Bccel_1836 [Pseudobacteroides cellulosolvens ATCC 35603 = DSM 2933]